MTADIRRLIAPRSIALIGAGAWTDAVAAGNAAVGYDGAIWRVHPTRTSTATASYYRSVADLPAAPDAAFIAVPNHEAPAIAGALAARGAGGFVCFTAGFSETGSEAGRRLTTDLLEQAGTLPFFGPNCYGFVNFFDRAAMLPDQVVGARIERGVALICQSGTIALTLMFNDRSLPIGCLFTVGNQTRIAVEDLIDILAEDHRVRVVSGRDQGRRGICARRRQGAFAGQAHRSDQIGTDRGGGTYRAQPYGCPGGCGFRFRCILPASRHCALRYAGHALRNLETVPPGRFAAGPQSTGDGGIRRRHGDDLRRLALARSGFCPHPGRSCGHTPHIADRSGHGGESVRYPHVSMVRSSGLGTGVQRGAALGLRCRGIHARLSAGTQGRQHLLRRGDRCVHRSGTGRRDAGRTIARRADRLPARNDQRPDPAAVPGGWRHSDAGSA